MRYSCGYCQFYQESAETPDWVTFGSDSPALTSETVSIQISKALTGNSARGYQGQLGYFYWQTIDDSQDANWQNIDDSQTAGWVLFDTLH